MLVCPKCGGLTTTTISRYGIIPSTCVCEWRKGEGSPNWDSDMDGLRLRTRIQLGLRNQHGLFVTMAEAESRAQFPESRFWYDQPETVTLG